jgi:hypothetical protein
MKPARASRLIDPPDCLATYLADMTEIREHLRQVQADAFRLIVASVGKQRAMVDATVSSETVDETAATIARLKNENAALKVAATAERFKDHNARGLTKVWLDAEQAGFRYGLGAERMRQLAHEGGKFVTRRDGIRILFLTASIDARLRSFGREPRLTREEQAARP